MKCNDYAAFADIRYIHEEIRLTQKIAITAISTDRPEAQSDTGDRPGTSG
jgi:hypothetical protein